MLRPFANCLDLVITERQRERERERQRERERERERESRGIILKCIFMVSYIILGIIVVL